MSERAAIENWMLHAYADGELDAQDRQEVERLLASDPAASAEVEAWLAQKAMLKATFDSVVSEPVPLSIAASLKRRNSAWPRPALMAAGFALLLIGGTAGWFAAMRLAPDPSSFVNRAIVAYEVYSPEQRHSVEVAASERDHLVAWLSKRIGQPLKIPDLTAEGYSLLGGRLLAAEDRPAAQLMYEDASKRRIAIFLATNPGGGETELLVASKGSVTACYWLSEHLGFVVTGEKTPEELTAIANIVYRQFES